MKASERSAFPIRRATTPEPLAFFTWYREELEEELRLSLSEGEPSLLTMLRYHLGWVDPEGHPTSSTPGKALRPNLCLFSCEAVGGDRHRALPAAAALELVHNFSLIHDDIQDNDTQRRHRPTVWSLWGKAQGIVAGNVMRITADVELARLASRGVSSTTVLNTSRTLAQNYQEIIEGQYLDISFESRLDVTTEEYLDMVSRKTGALIAASMYLGALMASEDQGMASAFGRCGRLLGLAFQIQDDYLGIWGDPHTTGKPVGSDLRRRKKTLPVVYALQQAQGPTATILSAAYAKETVDDSKVEAVLRIMDEVQAAQYTQALAEKTCREALRSLDGIPIKEWARPHLESLAEFLLTRQS